MRGSLRKSVAALATCLCCVHSACGQPRTAVDSDPSTDPLDASRDAVDAEIPLDVVAEETDVAPEAGDAAEDIAPDCRIPTPPGIAASPEREATECGPGCTQLTLIGHVLDYDVWGDTLVFSTVKELGTGRRSDLCGWIYSTDISSLETRLEVQPDMERCEDPDVMESLWLIGMFDTSIYFRKGYIRGSFSLFGINMCAVDISVGSVAALFYMQWPLDHGSAASWQVHDNRIIWADVRSEGGLRNLHWYDSISREERRLSATGCCVSDGAIWGDHVAWTDYEGYPYTIVVHNTATGDQRALFSDAFDRLNPDLFENKIVWTDCRQSDCGGVSVMYNTDIFLMDLETGEETRITSAPSYQDDPSIHGRYIVWVDARNDPGYLGLEVPDSELTNLDIYLYDLEEGREYQVTDFPDLELVPIVHNENVFFKMQDSSGAMSVFVKTIESVKAM